MGVGRKYRKDQPRHSPESVMETPFGMMTVAVVAAGLVVINVLVHHEILS